MTVLLIIGFIALIVWAHNQNDWMCPSCGGTSHYGRKVSRNSKICPHCMAKITPVLTPAGRKRYKKSHNSSSSIYDVKTSKIKDGSIIKVKKVGKFVRAYDSKGNDLTKIISSKNRNRAFDKNKNLKAKKDSRGYTRWIMVDDMDQLL